MIINRYHLRNLVAILTLSMLSSGFLFYANLSRSLAQPADTPIPIPSEIEPFATPTLIALDNLISHGEVVINEIGWSGSAASSADEWLELLNVTSRTITLTNGLITSTNGLHIQLVGTIAPHAYYLIERTDDQTISDITADLIASFGHGLINEGDTLFLSFNNLLIDTANLTGGAWPSGSASPNYTSMERRDSQSPDSPTNWGSNDTLTRNGLDAKGQPINGTPKQANSLSVPPPPSPTPLPTPTPSPLILISEFLYDGLTPSTEGDEFVELCNPNGATVDLVGYKVGDAETVGGEGMYQFPNTMVAVNQCVVIAKNADQFQVRFGFAPNFEVVVSGNGYHDNESVPNLDKYKRWSSGSWALANDGDELLLLDPNDQIMDSVAYRNGNYEMLGLELNGKATAPSPQSLQRIWPFDTNAMLSDFVHTDPTPGQPTMLPSPPPEPPPAAMLPDGMNGYWGGLHAHTSYSDGAGPPFYALAMARAAGLHFYAITDHDWMIPPGKWDDTLRQTVQATVPDKFIALRGVEWTHQTVGHINLFNTDILLSRIDPNFANLSQVYDWLGQHPEAIAQFNHPAEIDGGTFDNFAYQPTAAPMLFLQEIGNHGQGYKTYSAAFVKSNTMGWHVAPTNNGDTHTAHWGTDTPARTGLVAYALTEADLLEAMRARRTFATEDNNLALALRLNGNWMGTTLETTGPLPLMVNVVDPEAEPLTLFLYKGNLPIAVVPFESSTVEWTTTVEALAGDFFWVKVVQADGDMAYSAPIWINGQTTPEAIYINEILPAPNDHDWDGNGTADYQDEWIELFNPTDHAMGLGGWQLADDSDKRYDIPLDTVISASGFVTFYHAQLGFSLNNDGDTITLIHPNGTVIDGYSFDHSPGYDKSWCRLPDAGNFSTTRCDPTPNASNQAEAKAKPLSVSIYQAKKLSHDAWVKVEGWVTAPPELLGSRLMVIQDETAGIMIYLPKEHRLSFQLGDKVKVEGNLRVFHEEFEIAVSERSKVKFVEPGFAPPPLPIVTTSMLEPYEGYLVTLSGQAVDFQGSTTFWIDDGTDPAKVYLRQSTDIHKPFIERGTWLTVIGIVSQYSDDDNPSRTDYRLLPRYQSDLILPNLLTIEVQTPILTPTVSAPRTDWPLLLPETGK